MFPSSSDLFRPGTLTLADCERLNAWVREVKALLYTKTVDGQLLQVNRDPTGWVVSIDLSFIPSPVTFNNNVTFTPNATETFQANSGGSPVSVMVITSPSGTSLSQSWYPVGGSNPSYVTTSTSSALNQSWYPIGGTNPVQKIDVTSTTKTHTWYPVGGTNPINTTTATTTTLANTYYPTGGTNPLYTFTITSTGLTVNTYPTGITNPVLNVAVTSTTFTTNTYAVNVTQPVNTVTTTATTYTNNLFPVGSTNKVDNLVITNTTYTNNVYAVGTTSPIYSFIFTATAVAISLYNIGTASAVVAITYDANTFTVTAHYPTTTANVLTFAVTSTTASLQILDAGTNPRVTIEPTAAAGDPIVSVTPNDDQIGIIVEADSGQTADLQQWKPNGGDATTAINANGDLEILQDAAPDPADQPNCSAVPFISCTPGGASVSFLVKASDGSSQTLTLGGSPIVPVATATADATVTNSVAETSLIGTVAGSTTLVADSITPGQTVDFKNSGYYSSDAVPGNWQFKWYLGATPLWDSGSVSVPSGIAGNKWWFNGTLTCRTDGGAGTVMAQGELIIKGASIEYHIPANTTTATIDTTTDNAVDFTVTFDTADPDNTITSTNATITKGTPA